MKRTAKILFSISILSILLTLTGCYDPIFFELRKDVKPETATVSGNIPNITRYSSGNKEYLFLAADNGLRYKEADNMSHGNWGSYSLPFELTSFNFDDTTMNGQQIMSVIANSDTLYLVSCEFKTTGSDGLSIPSKINLWGKKITSENGDLSSEGDWTHINENLPDLFPIEYNNDTGTFSSYFNFFQTNSPMASHRHAYFCNYDKDSEVYKYYELKGTSAPVEFSITSTIDSTENTSTSNGRVYSAAYYNGAVRFLTAAVSSTDETYTNEANRIYFSSNFKFNYYQDSSITTILDNMEAVVSAIMTCSDCVIIGKGDLSNGAGSGGISKIKVVNGRPETETSDFATNAEFQITKSYHVIALLNATPDKNEVESALYGSITYINKNGVSENIGLWSYYPERGNWNRE